MITPQLRNFSFWLLKAALQFLDLSLKGLCLTEFNRFLNSQNVYLCRRQLKNNGPVLLTIAIRALKLKFTSVFWLRMARMEIECNLKSESNVFKSFPRVFKKSIFIAEASFLSQN